MKDNGDKVSGRKRWSIMSSITETSNWRVIGDLCQTDSEEWERPPQDSGFDCGQEVRKYML